ncbi:MAG: hypothetical protein JXB26_03905 [Candidatus Aminicenantes bacterium]|nr:hypothetical protein [Candidatus Aminicenantes bacterium]
MGDIKSGFFFKIGSLVLVLFLLFNLSACNKEEEEELELPSCGSFTTPEMFFTVLPLSIPNIRVFVVLGHMNPPGHTLPSGHGGFYLEDHTVRVDVYCPGDGYITCIVEVDHVTGGYKDYTIEIKPCEEFRTTFGHMSSLSDWILDTAGGFDDSECDTYTAGGATYTHCRKDVMIPVEAGEVIGTAGGLPGQYGLDFGTIDERITLDFANKERFADHPYLHAVSPVHYYSPALQAFLRSIAGEVGPRGRQLRTIPPIEGEVEQDVPGTAQGIWFREGAPTNPEDPHMALVHDNVDPTSPIISMGTSVPGFNSGMYTFTPLAAGQVDREFNQVTPDGLIYRYIPVRWFDLAPPPNTVLLVKMMSSTRIRVEKQALTDGPPWNFTGNAVDFIR